MSWSVYFEELEKSFDMNEFDANDAIELTVAIWSMTQFEPIDFAIKRDLIQRRINALRRDL